MEGMVILFVFGIPAAMVVLLVWIKKKERMKRYELQADLYAKALEKGEKIPDNLFEPAYMKYAKQEQEKDDLTELKRQSLFVGIILMTVGFAVALFLWLAGSLIYMNTFLEADWPIYIQSASAIGIVPFLIGVAFIIIHFIGNKKDTV